jgi:hypothetical protein
MEPHELDHRVSEAIAKHVGLMWGQQDDEAIRAEVGEEGLKRAREIDAFANRAELWTQGDGDQNYRQVQKELAGKYPFLSKDAIQRLSTRAAWGWR